MSSILKALKKLEHDKAVKKPETFRIDADILRGGSSRRYFSTGVLLAAIAVFACGVGATYFFMKPSKPAQTFQTSKGEIRSEPSTGTAPVVPASPPPTAEMPSRPSEHLSRQPAKLLLTDDKPERSGQSAGNQSQRTEAPSQAMPTPEPKPVTTSSTPPVMAKPATLRVEGIAFQDGGTEGVAVVNGVAVSKGSVIEGARVEEIQKDRVKFSRGGEKFEIVLDRTN